MNYMPTFQLMGSEDHRPSERETALGGVIEPPKWCGFLSIAPELRHMIYPDLIASGDTAILRVSKQVHDEAEYHLYKQGICRLRFVCGSNSIKAINPPESRLSDVQNFNLTIDADYYPYVRSSGRASFIGPDLQSRVRGSGSCHLTVVFASRKTFHMPYSMIELIRSLGNFKLVTVRAHLEEIMYHPLDRRNTNKVKPRHESVLGQMFVHFRTFLGAPEWKSELCHEPRFDSLPSPPINPFPTARYLEFHPHGADMSDSEPGVLRV